MATLATTSRESLPRIILVEDYALPAYDVPVPIRVHFTQVALAGWIHYLCSSRMEYYPRIRLR